MKLKEIANEMVAVLDDPYDAEKYLDENPNSQFARRTYIRSIFSGIEGTIWVLKKSYLKMSTVQGIKKVPIDEYCILKEITFELKKGKTKTITKFIRLTDNLIFIINIYQRIIGDIDIGVGTKDWTNFLESIDIRNRITHPKNTKDLNISDSEIETIKNTSSWFNSINKSVLDRIVKMSKKAHEDLNNK